MAVIELNADNFKEEITDFNGKALVDFWAEWCGPCMMLSPLVDEVDDEIEQGLHEGLDDVKICKVNCDESRELAIGFGISAIPCLLVFENGEVVNRSIGLVEKEDIINLLK